MAELGDADKIRILYDIECIKKLKHRYWRYVDEKRIDELSECFTEDAAATYADQPTLQGRDAILRFLRDSVASEELDVTIIHQGFNPEIDITGEGSARGRWRLYNYIVLGKAGTVIRTWSVYDDEYQKVNGQWRIKTSVMKRVTSESTTTT